MHALQINRTPNTHTNAILQMPSYTHKHHQKIEDTRHTNAIVSPCYNNLPILITESK
jgi:hypothetical protein